MATFALPMGAVLESWLEEAVPPKPVFSTFVLTGQDYKKVCGSSCLMPVVIYGLI